MKTKLLTILGIFLISMFSVMAYDASNPYTVTVNYIVGSDSSFTVELAGSETTIDFNPATYNSKNVEPDSQSASGSTPMITITNTGNVDLDFKAGVNATQPTWVAVSYDVDNTVDWTKTVTNSFATIDTSVAKAGTTDVYFWANFTSADSGTTQRLYQVNSTISA